MDTLSQLILFINEKQLWEDQVDLKRNEKLISEGSINTNLYYIVDGSLRAYVYNEKEELTIRFGYKNDLFGALDSYISGEPTNLNVQAIKHSKLKRMSRSIFNKMIEDRTDIRQLWLETLGQLLLQFMERERDLLTSSPEERYKRVLKRSPQLFQEIPHKYIASYLRMTPETLSRIKKL